MTRSTIRTRLRRRVNDVQADTWSNSELNDIINDAIHDMHQAIMALDKEAILYTWRANLVADQNDYSLPSGMQFETAVRILDSASGDYLPIPRWSRRDAEKVQLGDLTVPDGAAHVYAVSGGGLYLGAAPAANLTDGLEITGVPTLDLGADTDVPELPISMHQIIVYHAELILKPEGNDDTKQAEQAIARWRESLPTFYRKSGAPDSMQVEGLVKSW